MAKGNRDVNLTIRAKNEASKALDAVSAALATLTKSQADVARGSAKTSGLLTQLGTELGKLNQQIGGMSTMDRLTRSMEKAAGSVTRLETSISGLNTEQEKLAGEIGKTESAITGLNAKAQQLKSTLTQQSAAAKKAQVDLAALNAEVKSGEASLSQSVKNSAAYETQLQKLQTKLDATKTKHRELTQEILNAENPSARLIASFERTDAALQKQAAALTKAQAAYSNNRTATADMEQSLARLRAAQTQTALAFEQAKTSQASTAASLKQVSIAVRDAEKNLRSLQETSTDNAVALDRQDKALAASRVELAAVEQAAKEADVALDKIGNTVRQRLLRSLVDSQAELRKYQAAWQQATAAVRQAVASGASIAAPTPQLTQNIAVAQASKQAYLELQAALQQMRTAVREAGTDVVKLSGAQQTFVSALDRVKAKTVEVSAAQQQLAATAAMAGGAVVNTAARQAAGYQQVTSSIGRMTAANREAGASLDALEGKGRRALSWGQRLSSEMIALTTSFVGVYAAITQLQGVTKTFTEMEAVSSRMGVAFNGNSEKINAEMQFLQTQARRLGIDIRVLATEYSKLAIATNGSSLEGETTRKIFMSLAEAFRVNKLSASQMELAFNAVTQMVNKGSVSMEELRQQLGERLAGAFNLAAKSMGLTTKEFGKLVATGQLATEDFLPKLAEQLDTTFGPGLPKALDSLTTDIGKFSNAVTEAQMAVANSGYVEGLRKSLQDLTKYFQSADGVDFFGKIGSAAGKLLTALSQLPKIFDELTIVAGLWIGRKLTGYMTELTARFVAFRATLQTVPATVAATTNTFNAFSGAAGTYVATSATATANTRTLGASIVLLGAQMRTAVSGITAASVATRAWAGTVGVLRGAFAMLGGIPGILITGITVAMAAWLTGTDDVIDTTSRHEEQMRRLIELYDKTKGGAEGWAAALKEVNVLDASKVAEEMRDQLQSEIGKITVGIETNGNGVGRLRLARGDFGEVGKELFELLRQAERGEITINALSKRLNEMGAASSSAAPEIKRALLDVGAALTAAAKLETGLSKQVLVAEKAGGAISGVSPAVRDLTTDLSALTEATGVNGGVMQDKLVDPAQKFSEALDALRAKVPSLTDELKLLEQVKEIDEILKTVDAIKGIDKTSEAYQKLVATAKMAAAELRLAFDEKQFKDSYNVLANGGTAIEQSAALLRKREGFQETAKYDVNAYRAGFGSDTVTLADGSIQKVTQGMKVSVADANRDLVRRIGEFQGVIKNQVGAQRFAEFNPQQQAVLTSIAYNYGSLPERILDAVRSGSADEVANAIRGLAGDNKGINAGRRNEEAYLFQTAEKSGAEATTKTVDAELKAEEQRLEKAQQYHEQLAGSLELKKQESELDKQKSLQDSINLAIAKAENDAKKAGTVLSETEKQNITEITTNLYQRKAAEDAITKAKQDQEAADKRINLLTQLRRDILQQMQLALESGNTEVYVKLQGDLALLDEKLKAALESQLKLAQAMSDPEAAAAAAAAIQLQIDALGRLNQKAILTSFNAGKLFGDNLIAGADSFLAKIRETGDVLGSLKEAFRQFASDFLLQMAQMILKQAIFNALQAAMGGAGGGGFGGGILSAFGVGVQHNGGITGTGNMQRSVSPAWFANATRYHSGGVAGLKPNEVPTILEKGEEVLPANDPRHVNNGGGQSSSSVKIVNAIDAGSFVSAGVEDVAGQKAILNFMRANSGAVRGALGV